MPTSIGLRWYATGTVNVTQGSTEITGIGTNWSGAGIKPGDIFTVDNSTIYEVLAVNSNTSITLATAFAGVTGQTLNYSIIRNFAATMQAEIAAQVALLVNKYEQYIDTELETITGPKGDPGLVYKGVWAADREYNAMDVVISNSVLYLAKVAHISSAENAPGSLGSLWVDTIISVPPVVNDLTTGGITSALSAEMGKALNEQKFASLSAGSLENLATTAKSTLVAAINETFGDVGTVGNLGTTVKTDAVSAINEVLGDVGAVASLETTVKTSAVAAINELAGLTENLREAYAVAAGGDGAGLHNSFYRGKNLGSTFTTAQKNAIDAGTFDDLFIGDYWRMTTTYTFTDDNNDTQTATATVNWRIADCNYYLKSGDTETTKNHLIIVPDASLFSHRMNATDTTAGAYAGSEMRTANSGIARARALFLAAFGAGSLLSHRVLLQNAVTNGRPTGAAWMDSTGVELMTEPQVYGGFIFNSGASNGANVYDRFAIECKQFNLFRHRPDLINTRQWVWLQDVVSVAYFAEVNDRGNAGYDFAFNELTVRPAFVLCKPA